MYALAQRYTCNECASVRDRRDGCSFFPPSIVGWNSFRGPTPSTPTNRHRRSIASIILTLFLEAHPFSRSPTITGVCVSPSISIHRSRSATSKSVPIHRDDAVSRSRKSIRYTQKSQMDLTYVGEVARAFLKFTKGRRKRLIRIKGSDSIRKSDVKKYRVIFRFNYSKM